MTTNRAPLNLLSPSPTLPRVPKGPPNIFVSNIYEGTLNEVTKGPGENWLPAWSPDGTRFAFTSTRDGNAEIYVANRDGSNVRRLTNNPAIDSTPTWAPTGTQVAFTSIAPGRAYSCVPTGWHGPAPHQRIVRGSATVAGAFNEIASGPQPGFNIKSSTSPRTDQRSLLRAATRSFVRGDGRHLPSCPRVPARRRSSPSPATART